MSGASERRVLLVTNLVAEIRQRVRKGPCRVYSAHLRLWMPARKRYTYPDLMVVCSKPVFTDDALDTLLNPELIIEVLSPTTGEYDRGGKFASYRTMASLKEYVTVAQAEVHIEHHVRLNDGWMLTDHTDPTASIQPRSLGITLSLAEIYAGVQLDSPPGF